jgi:hypothetical protein
MRMTTDQFDEAVDLLRQGSQWPESVDHDLTARVFVAAGYILKHRLGISDDVMWSPAESELSEFLAGLSRVQRKKLKRIAESLVMAGDVTIH